MFRERFIFFHRRAKSRITKAKSNVTCASNDLSFTLNVVGDRARPMTSVICYGNAFLSTAVPVPRNYRRFDALVRRHR